MHILSTRMKDTAFYDGKVSLDSCNKKYFVFRGEANKDWVLVPKCKRGEELDYSNIDVNDDSRLGVFAQMYGNNNRVIDFTTNLKLALYYACKDEKYKDKDGMLYVSCASPFDLNILGSVIARYLITNTYPYRYPVSEMAYELIHKEEVKRLLNYYDLPDNNIITYICILINQFLRYGTIVFFDEEIYEKYPKIKKESGVIFYCGSKIYKSRKKPYKVLSELTTTSRAISPYILFRHCCDYFHYNSNFILYRVASECKDSILEEIYDDIKHIVE